MCLMYLFKQNMSNSLSERVICSLVTRHRQQQSGKCSDECDKKLIIYCNLIEKPHKANKSGYKLLNTIFYCRLLIKMVNLVSTS